MLFLQMDYWIIDELRVIFFFNLNLYSTSTKGTLLLRMMMVIGLTVLT